MRRPPRCPAGWLMAVMLAGCAPGVSLPAPSLRSVPTPLTTQSNGYVARPSALLQPVTAQPTTTVDVIRRRPSDWQRDLLVGVSADIRQQIAAKLVQYSVPGKIRYTLNEVFTTSSPNVYSFTGFKRPYSHREASETPTQTIKGTYSSENGLVIFYDG